MTIIKTKNILKSFQIERDVKQHPFCHQDSNNDKDDVFFSYDLVEIPEKTQFFIVYKHNERTDKKRKIAYMLEYGTHYKQVSLKAKEIEIDDKKITITY